MSTVLSMWLGIPWGHSFHYDAGISRPSGRYDDRGEMSRYYGDDCRNRPTLYQQEQNMNKKLRKTNTVHSTTLGQALLTGSIKFAGHIEVRGGYYHSMWEAKVDHKLCEGAWLKLVREPNNQHDANAIAVYDASGKVMLGHVAKETAERLAPYMDLGVKHAGRVLKHSGPNEPLRLTARLYIKR